MGDIFSPNVEMQNVLNPPQNSKKNKEILCPRKSIHPKLFELTVLNLISSENSQIKNKHRIYQIRSKLHESQLSRPAELGIC